MTLQPFEITRWDAPRTPDLPFLTRLMSREGLHPEQMELAADARTPELKTERETVFMVAAGHLQFALPGYGVYELMPGDMLVLHAHIIYDITVLGGRPAQYLCAVR